MTPEEIAAARKTASNDPISDQTDLTGHAPQGAGRQNPLSHSDSGNSGKSSTTEGGAGTAGSVPEAKPGAPGAYK